MKFEGYAEDVTEVLKLSRNIETTFQIAPVIPVELREHLIEEDGKIKVVDCLWNDGKEHECPYCITAKTLFKYSSGKDDYRKWYAKKAFFLPAMLKDDERLYLFRFRNKIHEAYKTVMTCTNYKGGPLYFKHKVVTVNGFPDYGSCSFSFNTAGKKKKIVSITVDALCQID